MVKIDLIHGKPRQKETVREKGVRINTKIGHIGKLGRRSAAFVFTAMNHCFYRAIGIMDNEQLLL